MGTHVGLFCKVFSQRCLPDDAPARDFSGTGLVVEDSGLDQGMLKGTKVGRATATGGGRRAAWIAVSAAGVKAEGRSRFRGESVRDQAEVEPVGRRIRIGSIFFVCISGDFDLSSRVYSMPMPPVRHCLS